MEPQVSVQRKREQSFLKLKTDLKAGYHLQPLSQCMTVRLTSQMLSAIDADRDLKSRSEVLNDKIKAAFSILFSAAKGAN